MTDAPPYILAVEDGDEDFDMLEGAFAACPVRQKLHRARDATEALQLLSGPGSAKTASVVSDVSAVSRHGKPCLNLLDLNLPDIDGRELLRQIKTMEAARSIPNVILTTSNNPLGVIDCDEQGAACYTLKPIGICALESLVALLKQFWLERAALPI